MKKEKSIVRIIFFADFVVPRGRAVIKQVHPLSINTFVCACMCSGSAKNQRTIVDHYPSQNIFELFLLCAREIIFIRQTVEKNFHHFLKICNFEMFC